MAPHRIDPKVNYRRLQELADELTEFRNGLQALYLDAIAGFSFVRSRVLEDQAAARSLVRGSELDSESFQDSLGFSYERVFSENFWAPEVHDATQGEVKIRNSPGGTNYTALAQLCVVALSDYWNDHLRREYVIAKGRLDPAERDAEVVNQRVRDHASHDLWGDLRILRNAIVHHRGVASDNVGRCKVFQWFQPGEPIFLTPEMMRDVFWALLEFRNDLFREGFPEHYLTFPMT